MLSEKDKIPCNTITGTTDNYDFNNPGLVIPSEQQNLEKGGIRLGILTLNIAEETKYMLSK